jgi:signal transduction histidine kinase
LIEEAAFLNAFIRPCALSIRLKVILPYLLLTLVVAVIGVYVVTRLVSNTLSERLTNQLLEAGRVVSDNFVRQEVAHVETGRIIAYTTGLAEALQSEDRAAVLSLVEPLASGLHVENLILITPRGTELVHLIQDETGHIQRVDENTGAAGSPIVTPYLANRNEEEPPRRALGVNLVDQKYYYYTSIPVPLDGGFAGVVVIGTSIDNILPFLKSTALADIIVYGGDGSAIGTTLSAGSTDQDTLQMISIPEDDYQGIILSEDIVTGDNFQLDGRWYRLARGPLQVGNDRVGVFAVALPLNFVIQSTVDNRTTYVILFTLVMLGVIAIGFSVTRLIINPLYSLVQTSQAIAGGDLEKRTGIQSKDEIGTLANTFDEMTSRLKERTDELEKTNELLTRMDKTKSNFIQISAHELRTPLTLIMGYSQMLGDKVKDDAEAAMLAKGILDGSERMTDIVGSMLDVSRIDSNSLFLKKTELQIEQLVNKVHKGFAGAFKERDIKFDKTGLAELPLVPADPELLQKVFHHLVMNAIKFTPDGGKVTVSGRYLNGNQPAQVEVAIRDTGIGIDPASHQLIFNKFYQTGEVLLHSSGKTKFKGGGPGLGLAIARGIVEAHGGKIWVESSGYNEQTNPGSIFFVTLPVEKRAE